jgi:hypothetical protein
MAERLAEVSQPMIPPMPKPVDSFVKVLLQEREFSNKCVYE